MDSWGHRVTWHSKIRCSFSKRSNRKGYFSKGKLLAQETLSRCQCPVGLPGEVCHRHRSLIPVASYVTNHTTSSQRIQFIGKSTHKTFSSHLHTLPVFVPKGEMLPQRLLQQCYCELEAESTFGHFKFHRALGTQAKWVLRY